MQNIMINEDMIVWLYDNTKHHAYIYTRIQT